MTTPEFIKLIKSFQENRKKIYVSDWNFCSDAIFLISETELDKIEKVNVELLKALQTIYSLIDRSVLVRDVSKDYDFNYFAKQGIEISDAVVLINKAIKNASNIKQI